MKLADKVRMLQRLHPKASPNGQLYKQAAQLKNSYRRVVLWTLFVSSDNTHMLRDHVFEKKSGRTPAQWAAFFSANLTEIHAKAILPGMSIRTGKQWAVQKILGWVGDAVSKSRNAKVGRTRHKTKRKGRKNG